jgi:hypothetical protein
LRVTTAQAVSSTYTFSMYAKAGTGPFVYARNLALSGIGDIWWDTSDFTVASAKSGIVASGAESVGSGWYRLWFRGVTPATITNNLIDIGVSDTVNVYSALAGQSAIFYGTQLELGSTATAYQKVTSQYVVTETGVPSVHYLSFDGVDDAMATPSIDFTGTDEMSVFAGVRKLSDPGGYASAFELSSDASTIAGTFVLFAGGPSAANGYHFRVGGTVKVNPSYNDAAPTTDVLTLSSDISADAAYIRSNGVEVATAATDQGTGNFSNNPLYIGARAGTSLYYNGHLYGLTVRGALTEPPTLSRAESLMANKTGITL